MEQLVILLLLGLAMACQLIAPCDAAQVQAPPVYDTNGHELTKENLYQILPADPKMSGLCLFITNLSPADCPLRAVVSRCFPKGGDAVMVMPAEASGGSVPRLSSDVLVTFNHTINKCMMELQWHVEGDYDTDQMHVTVGQYLAGLGPLHTERENRFRFRAERHGNGYKLQSCYEAPCRDLVLYDYEGIRWLTVEKDGRPPFVVVFKKCPWPCSPSIMPHAVGPSYLLN